MITAFVTLGILAIGLLISGTIFLWIAETQNYKNHTIEFMGYGGLSLGTGLFLLDWFLLQIIMGTA